MRKDRVWTVIVAAVAFAAFSVFVHTMREKQQREAVRAYVTSRIEMMEARAEAFYRLELRQDNVPVLRSEIHEHEDSLSAEFGVRVPCGQQENFFRWMKGWDTHLQVLPEHVRSYSREGGYRTFQEGPQELGEMYERVSFDWR